MSATRLSRRHFLYASGLTGAGLLLPSRYRRSFPNGKKVLILGAGMAGLSAARALRKNGFEVTILEAKHHAGGRVLTFRQPFAQGLFDDMGAARLPDNHRRLMALIREYELPTKRFYPEKGKELYQIGGHTFTWGFEAETIDLGKMPLEFSPAEEQMGFSGLFGRSFGPMMEVMGDPWQTDSWPSEEALAYDAYRPDEYFREAGFSEAVNQFFSAGWVEKGQGGMDVSMLWLARQMHWEATEKVRLKIEGGNDRLPKAMAEELAAHLRYGQVVETIGQDEEGVYALAQSSGGTRKYQGDYLICTLPFSVLKDLEIVPGFSPQKREVIHNLTYESLSRVVFQVRRPVWKTQDLTGFARTDFPVEIWHSNWNYPEHDRATLHVYVKSRQSRKIAGMNENDRQRYLLDYLETLYPGLKNEVEGGASQCWENDPFSKGAHVLPQPGEIADLFPHISTPEGRIYFAGEHASPVQGWIEGAIWSGEKAAADIQLAVARSD